MKKEKDEKLKLWNVGGVYVYRFSTKCATLTIVNCKKYCPDCHSFNKT